MDKLNCFIKNYWSYYIRLEKEFLETLNYVEFDKGNYKTFSLKYLSLILSICSEIDVVGKVLAKEYDSNFKIEDKYNNIQKWWFSIQNKLSYKDIKINKMQVSFLNRDKLCPWKNYEIETYINKKKNLCYRQRKGTKSETPTWWTNYNGIKHNRTFIKETSEASNYTNANLFNVIQSFAALYALEISYMQMINKSNTQIEASSIFKIHIGEK